ncbi:MAG: hypothetical protein EXQ58_05700 [Acidobacteria bacterium]|nr:hypothetical protein [Acidobacteriota bacterium]
MLSVSGAKDSFYTSELTLTNRGSQDAPVKFAYTAAFGEGSGVGNDLVPAGRQLIFSNAIDYLRSIGIPIPDSGNRGGTLTVEFGNLASTLLGSTIVRTATARPEGRAGLAYPDIPNSLGSRIRRRGLLIWWQGLLCSRDGLRFLIPSLGNQVAVDRWRKDRQQPQNSHLSHGLVLLKTRGQSAGQKHKLKSRVKQGRTLWAFIKMPADPASQAGDSCTFAGARGIHSGWLLTRWASIDSRLQEVVEDGLCY